MTDCLIVACIVASFVLFTVGRAKRRQAERIADLHRQGTNLREDI